jgi:hypothetical protein
MGRTGVVERHPERRGEARRLTDSGLFRKLAAGPLVELLWAVGLIVSLGVVSIGVSALLKTMI